MAVGRRTLLHDVNPHLICPLCRGYFIDATTVVECLHSFCRSCILKHLSAAGHCPSCKYVLNQAKPNIKADKTLQDIVYKLVPGLYHREMLKRREFYKKHPEHAKSATPEQRGEDVSGRLIFNPEDVVSLSLEYLPPGADPLTILLSTNDMDTNNSHDANSSSNNNNNSNHNGNTASNRRYLRCPALVTIAHLKKFVAMKYSVDITRYTIEICHRRAPLPENWTLMDVAYKYAWKRIAPMRFFYRVAQEEQRLEAPLHQRPSTPGLGARDCLPPNDARDDNNIDDNLAKHSETSRSEVKSVNDSIETISLAKDLNKITNDKISSPINRKQITIAEKDEANKTTITIASTTSSTTTVSTSPITTVFTTSPTMTVSVTSLTMTVSVTSLTTTVFATSPTTIVSATTSPTTTVSAASPTTTVSAASPTTTVSATSSTTTVSATSPTTMVSATSSTTTVSATSPTTTVSATSPTTTVSATSPTTTVSATSPTTTVSITSPTLTATNMMMLTTTSTNTSLSTVTTCNDSNKQKKSPIKILKNPDGRYEVLKNPPITASWNGKEQATTTTDIKCPTNPEFSVVNSNGVKLTLKQCSPPQSSSTKKLKVISNVLLRCSQMDKDASSSSTLMIQQLQQQQDKEKVITTDPATPDKQEKQRRKVTFVDRLPTSEKTSPSVTVPKTALKKPAEQQDKKQFLQGFQLTAREPSVSDDSKLKSPNRDISVAASTTKPLQKNTILKIEEFSKKDANEVKKKSNTENADSNANNTATNMIAKRAGVMPVAGNMRGYANQTDDIDGSAFNSGTSPNSANISSGNHAKMDVYTFSSDPPIVPAGAVKRKCPPGVPIVDLKRRKSAQITQRQELNKKQNVSLHNPVVKLPRISNVEHIISTNRTINMAGDGGGSSRISNVNNVKASTGSSLSNDTRDFLVDGYGLNIPASLSITLTSPRSPGTSGQFVEPNDPNDNNRKAVLGKVNPTITLNNRSVDPRVLKALKTGQIRMPANASKIKTTAIATAKQATTTTTDRSEIANHQQRSTTLTNRRKREHESSRDILDLSGGNKKMDIHPLRIPQPVTKLNKGNKVTADRDNMQTGGISDQGQVVTLIGGHRYYRAPPGSLTPAAHRVNDCPPLPPSPSRTPVYAPSFSSINRSSSDLSSVFPSLPSLYALHQAPNLQQFQMDAARLRLPPPRSTTESSVTSLTGNIDNANSSISGMSGKSHLAAQCAPVKPARSSVAPLAVPINKQQSTDKPTSINVNRTLVSGDANKPPAFRNNESLDSTDETPRMTAQRRYSLGVENTNNRFLSSSKNEGANSNNQTTAKTKNRASSVEPRNESIDTNNLMQQQQQHREAASPSIVSSTASSPPPANDGANMRNENGTSHSDNNIRNNSSNEGNNATPSPTKSKIGSEMTCNKSPVSPDSSSITVESLGTSKNSISTDGEMPTEVQTSSDTAKTSDSTANPDDSIVDDLATSDDKNKFVNKPEASEIAKQLTSEIVQKRLLAVFPSNEWANNPVAAEHLGNFLKSLNATMKNEGHTSVESMKNEESKVEKIDLKTTGNDDTKSDK